MKNQFAKAAALAVVSLFVSSQSAHATLLTGPGGQGVPAGQSSLISTYDYSDSFTGTDAGGQPNRPFVAAVQTAPTYVVENTYGNAPQNFQTAGQPAGVASFSIASDTAGLVNGVPTYPGASGAGTATGFTQTGNASFDYGLSYGLRNRYLVQFDAVATGDRIDITSAPNPGTIFQGNSLSLFFRATGGLSLFNGTTDTPVPGFNSGLTGGGQWHNYAVLFDQTANSIQLFVDEQSKDTIDLSTFAGGLYQNYSNGAVSVGGGLAGGENRIWTDNFQVGSPAVPEPAAIGMLAAGTIVLASRRRRAAR
jgi:hypothetical protein